MTKGNWLMSQARGSVGDITFYRMDGQQIARSRNRKPKNPRTNAQLYQRAIIATTMRAYSAGKEIFDHSFEGLSVGMKNMREFLRLNADALRNAVKYDLGVQPTNHINAVVNAPKTNTPVPNKYIISKGSLQNNLFVFKEPTENGGICKISTPPVVGNETVAQYFERLGVQVGDIFTFVGFTINKSNTVFVVENGIGTGAYQEESNFFFVRLIVNDGALATTPAEDALLSSVFEIDTTSNVYNIPMMESTLANMSINADTAFTFEDNDADCAVVGCIRSKLNEKLRSNETLHWVRYNNVYGIDWMNLLLAWTKEVDSLGNSELILEGYGTNAQTLNPDGGVGLKTEGNFLSIIDENGIIKIATNEGVGVTVTGNAIAIAVNTTTGENLRFFNKQNYYGARQTQEVTISVDDWSSPTAGKAQGYFTINAGGNNFKTDLITLSPVNPGQFLIPISAFKLA